MFDLVPGVREEVNEREALRRLATDISMDDQSGTVRPLLEITEKEDMNNLGHYTGAYDEVLVDFPRYLQDRESKLKNKVENLVSKFTDPTSFHLQTDDDEEYTPVVSGEIDDIDHSGLKQHVANLSGHYERICVRLFIPTSEFIGEQKETVDEIVGVLRDEDAILADVVDLRDVSRGIRQNIEYIEERIEKQDLYVFDMFEPRRENGTNYNYGLIMGKYAGVDGIGDFVLEPRFPSDIPNEAFGNIPNRVRQYNHSSHAVETWEDDDYYVEATENMLKAGDLDPGHCPYCEELYDRYRKVKSDPDRKDLNPNIVKQLRIDHYMYSVLNDEFPDLANAKDAKEFDPDGYDDII